MMHELQTAGSTAQDEAAFWFARMRSDSASARDRARLDRWLDDDPANAAAYAECEARWSDLKDAAADEVILSMRKQALVLGPRPRRFQWERLAAAAAIVAFLLLGDTMLLRGDRPGSEREAGVVAQLRDPNLYRTEVGQRSTITLADGSLVELNTASVLQVNYTRGRRDVRLLRGQAMFEVAHDSGRPFVVEAGGQHVTALGTKFDVRLESNEMRVTLMEGVVAVENGDAPGTPSDEPRRLRPGEQLIAAAHQPFVVRKANVEQAVSWRSGRLIFTDEPLGEAIEEINRYSTRKVVLGDQSLGALRVSGVFRTGSTTGFVIALDASFPVTSRVDGSSNTIVLTWQ